MSILGSKKKFDEGLKAATPTVVSPDDKSQGEGVASGAASQLINGATVQSGELRFTRDLSIFSGIRAADLRRKQVTDLYDETRPSLASYLMGLGMSADRAEDVIQESFLRLVRHLLEGGKSDNLRGWLFRVAHNLSMDLHRHDQRIISNPVSNVAEEGEVDGCLDLGWQQPNRVPSPEQEYLENEHLARVKAAMSRLTPQQRSCVLLRAEGLAYRDIAPVLGVSIQRVSRLMRKALVRLAEEL